MQSTSSPKRGDRLNGHADERRIAIPMWAKLGAVGLGTLLLAQWVPIGLKAIPVVAGAIMILGAFIWGRVWVTQLVPRDRDHQRGDDRARTGDRPMAFMAERLTTRGQLGGE
jgi:hypothetical protein